MTQLTARHVSTDPDPKTAPCQPNPWPSKPDTPANPLAQNDWAYKLDIHGPAKCVIIYLCRRADSSGRCFPTQNRMATELGICRNTITNAVHTLEQNQFITVQRRPNHTNTYSIHARFFDTPNDPDAQEMCAEVAVK